MSSASGKTDKRVSITYYEFTDKGSRPGVNQDAIFSKTGDEISVFCVADGMGGHSKGELASKEIVDNIKTCYEDIQTKCDQMTFFDIADRFETAIKYANKTLYDEHKGKEICGSTIVAMVIWKDNYIIFSAGDSRIYRRRGVHFEQITRDDVWQNQASVLKMEDKDQLKEYYSFDKLINAIGIDGNPSINRISGKIKSNDVFLLCSDGIYKCFDEKNLNIKSYDLMLGVNDKRLKRLHDGILKIARDGGMPDNYSLITVGVRMG